MTAEVRLTGRYALGRVALVDAEDVELVEGWHWYYMPDGYARTHMRFAGKRRTVSLHRFVFGVANSAHGLQVDHINRDRLDCRKENLRLVEHAVNRQNTGRQTRSTSGFRGVHLVSARNYWQARVQLNGVRYRLGSFKDPREAALAVEAFRAEHMPWVAPDPALKEVA